MMQRRNVISTHVTILASIFTLLAILAATALSLRTELQEFELERSATLEQTEGQWLPLLARAAWILSEDDIEMIALAISQQSQVTGLRLTIDGGPTVMRGELGESDAATRTWPIEYERDGEIVTLGSLTIGLHRPSVLEQASVTVPKRLPADLIRVFIVLVPLIALVHIAVTRQLGKLSHAVRSVAANIRSDELPEIRVSRRKIFRADDELDDLVRTFNVLLNGIRDERNARSDRESELKQSLTQSHYLLREVHHRVKNNLQMLISLFTLQAEHLGETEREVMKEAETRIRSLALVHTQLYQKESVSGVELVSYTEALLHNLTTTTGGQSVRHSVEGDRVEVPIDTAIPLALVLNELTTNSLKHAFPPGHPGLIEIVIRRGWNRIELTICDDGVGVPDGFSIEGGSGFGLSVVNALMRQLSAEIEVRTRDQAGTCFELTIPMS